MPGGNVPLLKPHRTEKGVLVQDRHVPEILSIPGTQFCSLIAPASEFSLLLHQSPLLAALDFLELKKLYFTLAKSYQEIMKYSLLRLHSWIRRWGSAVASDFPSVWSHLSQTTCFSWFSFLHQFYPRFLQYLSSVGPGGQKTRQALAPLCGLCSLETRAPSCWKKMLRLQIFRFAPEERGGGL